MKESNNFKKNQYFKTEITDITDLGFGVGRYGDLVIFVSDTVTGDVVEGKIIKVNSTYLVGRVENYIVKSPLRVADRCDMIACKSCAFKNVSYATESKIKEEKVRHIFCGEGLENITTLPIITSPCEKRYRNKAQYPIALINSKYEVGFFAPKSHRVTPISDCPLTPAVFSEITEELKLYFAENNLTVYDEESGKGLLRHVYLRCGTVTGEILLTLVVNGESVPNVENLVGRITKRFKNVVGILLNVNKSYTNVVLGEKFITLYGREYIYDYLCGVKLKITAPSFYQVNHDCAELLYNKARELASLKKTDTVLDLYCGAGSIGLSMARDCGELLGIEIIESAVKCAEENAINNGFCNAKFYTGDAKDTEKLLDTAKKSLGKTIKPDVIILDPPRSGCDATLLDFVARLNPRTIVYISCNPKTLARDVKILSSKSYTTDSVTPVDMFPCTGHVESLVCLTKQTN